MIPYVLPLADTAATLSVAGGKGASLARLAQAGVRVPAGFHVTTEAYRRFIAGNNLQQLIVEAAQAGSVDDPASLDNACAAIEAMIAQARMPAEIVEEIRKSYAALGGAVAVRSSATAEDLPGMSFAGQLETFLNVRDGDHVIDAVQRCWASLWTARAIGYRIRNGIAADTVSIAVVVQELVPAEVAGVMFTANPVTGARDEALINAAWGLGEAVVGGLVTPDTFVVNRKTKAIVAQDVAVKEVMTVRLASGTHEEAVPANQRKEATLTREQAVELTLTGERIEKLYGMPMDVEWALCGGEFSILQARPITALPEPRVVLDWSIPRQIGRYARSSVIELLPEPLTPLFRTLGLPAFNEALRWLFEVTMRLKGVLPASYQLVTINDFAYYDFGCTTRETLGVFTKVPGAIPRVFRMMKRAKERWLDEARPAYAERTAEWAGRDLSAATRAQLLEGALEICRLAGRYYVTIQAGILPIAYSAESLFTKLYDRFARREGDPPATVFVLGFDSIPIQSEKSLYDLAMWVREHGDRTPEFESRLAAHLERFGGAIYDLDFAKPLPAENPAPLIDAIKYFVSGAARNPYERQAQSADAREKATRELLDRLGFIRRPVFRWILGIAQRYAPLRENSLADVGMGWLAVRRMLREVGQRLVAAGRIAEIDDVFWLEYAELEGDTIPPDAVTLRKAKWEKERRVIPPVMLPAEKGARLLGFDLSGAMPAKSGQSDGDTIRGVGSSPGRVTGVARVIQGPDEFAEMKPGDILVAKATTPAWTPLFALAAGIVTDVGGPLSHSSIVAREYRIPAVLGTGVATARIRKGQQIVVDGDAGTVTLR